MHCATAQVNIAEDKNMRRFFIAQARQERHHALVFSTATRWFQPKRFQHLPHPGLSLFEDKLNHATQNNKLAESVVAQQLLFEGLGEITLEKVSQGIEDRGFGFQRLRKTILKQEKAHHQFGIRHYQKILNDPELDMKNLASQCKEYLEILQHVLENMQNVLQFYHQDAADFYTQLVYELPETLRIEL